MKKKLLTTALALAAIFSIKAQNVNIPDANFKACLLADNSINTNADSEIQLSEAAVATTIICGGLGITDLTGIEAFTSLTTLACINNQLTSLDLSNNMVLVTLYCGNNQFTSLDVSNHTSLSTLYCGTGGGGLITNINVTNCTALADFRCMFNQLTSLDVSTNTSLTYLDCSGNNFTNINVANGNNTNLATFYAYTNPNLTCIQVDDVVYSNTNWTGGNFQFPAGVTFSQTPCPTAPNAPSNLVAALVGANVNLNWQDNSSDEDGFEVFAPQSLGDTAGVWNQLFLLGSNVTSTTHGTTFDGLYCYKVRAYKGALKSEFTEVECVEKNTTGIAEATDNDFLNIFPNPANSLLNLKVKEKTYIQIENILGETITTKQLQAGNNIINISDLVNGIYFIRSNNGQAVKFVKE